MCPGDNTEQKSPKELPSIDKKVQLNLLRLEVGANHFV